VKVPPIIIKPTIKDSSIHSSIHSFIHSIDTLIRLPKADIYVYSDDIEQHLYIEPIFYNPIITIKDTVIKPLPYEVVKPQPWYDTFEMGVVVGAAVIGAVAWIFSAR
jgi:hypothetical protein